MVSVKIQLCGGIMPAKAHEDDACFDLYVPKETVIKTGRQIIPLDFKIQLPKQYCAHVRSRSGFSSKGLIAYFSCDKNYEHPIRVDAVVITGIVDCGFTGIVGVILKCTGRLTQMDEWSIKLLDAYSKKIDIGIEWDGEMVIKAKERIAQLAIVPVPETVFEVVDKIDDSERGEGGFGSTNEKGGAS